MAIAADNPEEAAEILKISLSAERLKLVEAEQFQIVDSADEAESVDTHLAENIRDWEPGRSTVWGTIHVYVGNRHS